MSELSPNEQARVIAFISKFQANPAQPGVSLERIERASPNVWSGRVSQDLRAILYKDGETWAIVHVDHHNPAYKWAERKDIGRHSVTGALQIVETIETVKEVERIIEVFVQPEAPPLFDKHQDGYLLSLGLPETWLPTLRRVKNADHLLAICEKVPEDVAERLFALAAGDFVTPPKPISSSQPTTDAADTRRRFFIAEDAAGLRAALEAPLDRWIAFLHPSQKELVERKFSGPSKVSGAAGTGKTVVAMHRARYLANQGHNVLLTSFATTLCENIKGNLAKLCSKEELEQITVLTVHKVALSIARQAEPKLRPANDSEVKEHLKTFQVRFAPAYSSHFIFAEWENVVRAQGISTWPEYRRARRTGRGSGLGVKDRKVLWNVFDATLGALAARKQRDWPGLCRYATELIDRDKVQSPYDAIIVDEVQDLKVPELLFLQALCGEAPENFMVCGDSGQRIYPGGFSLSALGIEVRGRSSALRINYRTTEQIRRAAERLLGAPADDMDGGTESRQGTRSLLRGPEPQLKGFSTFEEEIRAGVGIIEGWISEGLGAGEIGVFARTGQLRDRLGDALSDATVAWCRLSDQGPSSSNAVQLGTMHRAKGLEFKAVLVTGCGDKEIPNPAALAHKEDPSDREAALGLEQRLLYVAMTRARDELAITWSRQPSRFLAALLPDQDLGETE